MPFPSAIVFGQSSRPVDTQFNTASEVLHNLNKLSPSRARCFSSTIPKNQDAEQMGPRWAQTPRGMSMPFRLRPRPKNNEWKCNDDPTKVDAMYKKFLGEGGDKLLSDEVRWLAITHKSFDQGKRGFNDRLAYMGPSPHPIRWLLNCLRHPDKAKSCQITDQILQARESLSFRHQLL